MKIKKKKKKFKLLLIYPDLLFSNPKFSMGSLMAKEDAMQQIQKVQTVLTLTAK